MEATAAEAVADERTRRLLDYPRVLERLSQLADTVWGRERCGALLPAARPEEVAEWLQETREAVDFLGGAPSLSGLGDPRESLARAVRRGVLTGAELLALGQVAAVVRRFRTALDAGRAGPLLTDLGAGLADLGQFEAAVGRAIVPTGEVADAATPELGRLRRRSRALQAKVRESLEAFLRSEDKKRLLQDPLITLREGRYVLPVRQEHRDQVPGVVHGVSASGATLFVEPMAAVQLNNQLAQLMARQRREEERILTELSGLIARDGAAWEASLEALGRLDFALAKARLAGEHRAIQPRLEEGAAAVLRGARHPLLGGAAVPIELELGRSFTVLVISGPNTGGKTVALRTLGLLALMAQAGLFVPAAEGTQLGVFPRIFADIGDEQGVEQNLSTFSSHLSAIVGVLEQARPGDLVLLDELGAGTDPEQGAALAQAILEELQGRGVLTVVTSHYGALKAFAYLREGMENAAVEFDEATLRPTYRLLLGAPGSSNALRIAARLGVPEAILKRAEEFLTREELRIEEVLRGLEEERRGASREREAAVQAGRDAAELLRRAQEQLSQAEMRATTLREGAREEARQLLSQTERQVREALRELRRAQRSGEEEAGRRVQEQLKERLQQVVSATPPPQVRVLPAQLLPGTPVYARRLGLTATVLEAPAEGQVLVQAGLLKVRLGLEELELAERAPEQPRAVEATGVGALTAARAREVAPEVHLRGMRVEEAMEVLERYLDDCQLAGVETARIIHGKGTGTLRRVIWERLRGDPRVAELRLGGAGEGEHGVTVVRFNI
ncbi:MAG: endonuclease MutS2 [Thermaerobacter sp.]|nr:endonuclease MutS2 [Thermaerobacter sp.]